MLAESKPPADTETEPAGGLREAADHGLPSGSISVLRETERTNPPKLQRAWRDASAYDLSMRSVEPLGAAHSFKGETDVVTRFASTPC
jgi:hypothetical protein